jgi:molecular chaperone GrpE
MVDAKDQGVDAKRWGQKAPPRQTLDDQPGEAAEAEVPARESEVQSVAGDEETTVNTSADVVEMAEGPPLAERLAEAEREIAKVKDDFLRALAETENVRRRAARDKADASKYAIASFARDILPVADNLRRAADTVDAEARKQNPALEALVAGVEMTEKELLGVLARYGITPIEAEGQRFDPHVHEAMYEVPDESVPHGTVVQVLERGFMIHDRPLRPSRVGVSRGGPREHPSEAPDAKIRGEGVEPLASGGATAYENKGEQAAGSAGTRYDEKL